MREILFRGKRVDSGEWVFGVPKTVNYIEEEPEDCRGPFTCIITGVDHSPSVGFMSPDNRCFVEVDHQSVGQYIGLLDRDGVKVFEKDYLIGSIEGNPFEGHISWQHVNASFVIRSGKRYVELGHHVNYGDSTGSYLTNFKVVGNIVDNPELIKTE